VLLRGVVVFGAAAFALTFRVAERFRAVALFLTFVAPRRDAADRALLPRLLFALLLVALREALLPDFLRDFLALVAIRRFSSEPG
jgi:hypothetical protein